MVTDEQLALAIAELKANGSAALVRSRDLLEEALQDWASDPYGNKREYRWRQTCLIRGAILGLHGNWQTAAYVYSDLPEMPAIAADCTALAALMAIGQSVALWHMGDANAGHAALCADDYFSRLPDDNTFGRWRGIGALIMSITRPHTVHTDGASASAAASAKRLLSQEHQPRTYDLACYVNGSQGRYRTQLEILADGLGEIPAHEGLYLFNE